MNFIKHLKVLYNTFLDKSNETHKTIIKAIMNQLGNVETDLNKMILELCILTATGDWLNEWGNWFGVYRRINESDSDFSERIIISIKSPKSTLHAIKEHSANFLNYEYSVESNSKYTKDDIEIYEPWKS